MRVGVSVQHRLEAWERRELPVLNALPFVMLGFCTLLTALVRDSVDRYWLWDLGLCGIAAVWLAALPLVSRLARLTPSARSVPSEGSAPGQSRSWADMPVAQAVFFAGLIAIMTVLVIHNPFFGFFTFTGYLLVTRLPFASWRVIAVIAVAVLTGSAQAGGFATAGRGATGAGVYAGCVLVNLAVSGAFMWFGYVGHTQHERRGRLVEELREANRRLEASLAENAGLHEQLLTQAREAGVLDERQRMAREIHDTIAQGLTGIITQLQAAEQAADDPVEQRRHFDAAVRLARESLTEARRSVDALRPEPLEGTRLADALVSVADRWSALHGVPASVTATGAARSLSPEAEVVLLRVAQEALANVAKHAAATRAWLTLSFMDGEVALDVRDDGRGFDPVAGRAGGFGLMAMRQRVEGLSGTLQVESEPSGGTVISACVPVVPGAAPRPGSPLSTGGEPLAVDADMEQPVAEADMREQPMDGGQLRPEVERAEPNRAEPNRAEPNRAEPNRAEASRVEADAAAVSGKVVA